MFSSICYNSINGSSRQECLQQNKKCPENPLEGVLFLISLTRRHRSTLCVWDHESACSPHQARSKKREDNIMKSMAFWYFDTQVPVCVCVLFRGQRRHCVLQKEIDIGSCRCCPSGVEPLNPFSLFIKTRLYHKKHSWNCWPQKLRLKVFLVPAK